MSQSQRIAPAQRRSQSSRRALSRPAGALSATAVTATALDVDADAADHDVADHDVADHDVAELDVADHDVAELEGAEHDVTELDVSAVRSLVAVEAPAGQHSQHPLRARRRPGPPGADAAPAIESELEDAARVLELVEQGVLPADGPPPLPIPVDAHGKPRRRLTPEDEALLGYRIQTWGDIDARNALVLANLGLVHLVANQMRRAGIRYEDLVQEGTLGLLRATETFEPDRGVRFSTYCVYWIRAKIQRLLQRQDRDDSPSIVGAEMETLEGGRRRRPRSRAISLDAPVGVSTDGDDRTVGDLVTDDNEDPEDATIRFERDRAVDRVLTDIAAELGDPRLKTIIEKRLLADEPETLAVLGDRLNLSREGARLLENKVLKLARQRLDAFSEAG
jgi:RNA polymerase sigma factor (sigma-70 family)